MRCYRMWLHRPQGSVPDVEAVHAGNDSLVRASDGDRGGPKIAAGIEADRSSQWVHPKILRNCSIACLT